MATLDRQQAERRGRRAERAAVIWLRLKGYRILAQRQKMPGGEIDIIARKGAVICFVEVKARNTREVAITSVSQGNWQRIATAAGMWMARHPQYAQFGWRYDLIAIGTGAWPMHLKDAWRPII